MLRAAAELILAGASRNAKNGEGKTPAELTDDPNIHALFVPVVKAAH